MEALDTHDIIPEAMRNYLSFYGFHFNKKCYEFAVGKMYRKDQATGKRTHVEPYTLEETDELLKRNNVSVNHGELHDKAFVATMAKADYYKSSITDEAHLALFIKDYLDDEDAPDGVAFRRWYATMVGLGIPVDFNTLL